MLAAVLLTLLVVTDLPGTTIDASQPAPLRPRAQQDQALVPALLPAHELILTWMPSEVDELIDRGWLDYPSGPRSYFDIAQVVSFYGHPSTCIMGELGCHASDEVARRIGELALEYEALNGSRYALPALHLIVDVASKWPQADGSYLDRMPEQEIAGWVELARTHGYLLFLDLQIGWSDPLASVQRLEPFLVEPFVHIAIDPEFATGRSGVAPGEIIGTLRSDEVNEVQSYLGDLVREHRLPKKILVLHQFRDFMLWTPEHYDDVGEVEVTIDMDGWGSDFAKLTNYEEFARADLVSCSR
jgi:hypothetical protein